jgi:hypothetical protein
MLVRRLERSYCQSHGMSLDLCSIVAQQWLNMLQAWLSPDPPSRSR